MSTEKIKGLAMESLSIGIFTVIVGLLIHTLATKAVGYHDLNNLKTFAGHLFVIAIAVHLLYQATGMNKWYCQNGVACRM
jgi:ABC-type spermidine/putrescine transport system permease subunit II